MESSQIIEEGIMLFNSPIHVCFKGIMAYFIFFGTKYIGNDIQNYCGNVMDKTIVKIFTLFCIMYQATGNFKLALFLTFIFGGFFLFTIHSNHCCSYIEHKDRA
jgi:hypothetical protein